MNSTENSTENANTPSQTPDPPTTSQAPDTTTPPPTSKFDLKTFIEKNTLIVLVVTVFATGSAIYGIVNGWYEREYKLKTAELQRTYDEKTNQLDTERTRIKVTIETESKYVRPDRVFVAATELPSDYSVAQDGIFAMPRIQEGNHDWKWAMHNEEEIIGEALGAKQLKELLPDEQKKLLKSVPLKVLCYESPQAQEIKTSEFVVSVRPRATFERVTWDDISKLETEANASRVQGLFDVIDNFADGSSLYDINELFIITPEISNSKKSEFLREPRTIKSAARVSLTQFGRAALFLDYVRTHLPADEAEAFAKAVDKEEDVLRSEDKKKEEEKKKRAENKVKVEPDKLETFLGMFAATGSGNQLSPYGSFKSTDYTFTQNAFSIQGYYDLTSVSGLQSKIKRIYRLQIGFMREDGLYLIGFVYPANNDFAEFHQLMSLIDGVRIVR